MAFFFSTKQGKRGSGAETDSFGYSNIGTIAPNKHLATGA